MPSEYPKLVRDRIPEIIKEDTGMAPECRTLSDDAEFLEALLQKAVEEASELRHSSETGDLEEELADLSEVIDAILALKGRVAEDIRKIQEQKREKRGGFEKRILMQEPPQR